MNELSIQDRAEVFDRTVKVVESKHFNPEFDKRGWRQITADRRDALLQAESQAEFEDGLSVLIRNVGPPDCGLIQESERRKVPKGIAARFQYCEPAQCALGVTQPSPGGDVMISRLDGQIGWLKVTKFPGAVGIDIARRSMKE